MLNFYPYRCPSHVPVQLLLRSVARWELYLTKLLATLCVTTLLVTTAVLALYAAIYAGTPEFWNEALPRAARVVARRELSRIGHTMALEDQAVGDEEDDERLRRFIAEELDPRDLWGRR